MSIRLLVADDHEVVRRGLATLFEGTDIEIVHEAADGAEATKAAKKHKPDVVLMDIRMPNRDGLESLAEIRKKVPDAKVVMLSTYDNPTYVARSVALGAWEYVLKGSPRQEIISAVQRAAAGQQAPVGSLLEEVRDAMRREPASPQPETPVTPREAQVLRHIALGLSNREIASSLGISVETVKEHVQNILRKIEAVDRTQAAVWAVRKGLV